VEFAYGVLLVFALVAITAGVAREGELLISLGTCTFTVISMSVSGRLHEYSSDHGWGLDRRVLLSVFGSSFFVAGFTGLVAWATEPEPAFLGTFDGFLVWLLGRWVWSLRDTIRDLAARQTQS
jgi:hypothetical protein